LLGGCSAQAPQDAPPQAPLHFQGEPDPDFLEQYTATQAFRLGRPTAIQLSPKGETVLFLRSGPRAFERDLRAFDPQVGDERVLLTAQQILAGGDEVLTAEEAARRERLRLTARGIASYQLASDGTRILVPLSGRLFVVERATGAVIELPSDGG